jgi:23S rRNA (cytosine1962-C5)-methyltransferase
MSARPRQDRPTRTPPTVNGLRLLETGGFSDYRLLDSGNARKLERFGRVVVDRPEPQALWSPKLPPERWQAAHAVFSVEGNDEGGRWRTSTGSQIPESWPLRVQGVTVHCRLSAFRHLGLFPEQVPHWEWMVGRIEHLIRAGTARPRVLNLFGYTGAATILAAKAGAEVVHVDASKKAIAWARENQAASGLTDAPVRWLLDDARKFVARELRRNRAYHLILLDPPPRGHGPTGELWEMFDHLPGLTRDCVTLLDRDSAGIILTAYAVRLSALSIGNLLGDALAARRGVLDCGELAIREEGGGRAVPTSLYARWCTHDLAR